MKFTVREKIPGCRGRAGVIQTENGNIETPAFIPVATKATIKSLTPEQVGDYVGAQAVLANTYHLYLQPGVEVLRNHSGLGKFMNWQKPTFTDSGGFQAFSLGSEKSKGKIAQKNILEDEKSNSGRSGEILARVNDEGVSFKSIIDGSEHFFTPERSIEIQQAIGADIIFAFDECISPHASFERQKKAIDRTAIWAKRCLDFHRSIKPQDRLYTKDQALFGIVQGGRYEELRKLSAKTIGSMDFDGFGVGGSFDKEDIGTAVGWVADELPENKPRHLLGIGEPGDLILGIENGMDTFDCVAPTRIARNGAVYINFYNDEGAEPEVKNKWTINLLNSRFIQDLSPIDRDCACYTCKKFTRSYLAHLFRAKEMLASTLASIHNLYFVVNLVAKARKAIIERNWEDFKKRYSKLSKLS